MVVFSVYFHSSEKKTLIHSFFLVQNLHFPDKPFLISPNQEPQQMEPGKN